MWIYIRLLLTSLFWAGTFIAGRILSRKGGFADPASAAFLRFAIASVIMLVFIQFSEEHLPRLNLKQSVVIFLLGLTGVFMYHILFLTGLRTVEASGASVIIATSPVFIAIFSVYFFSEILTLPRLAGVLLSVTGAMVVIMKGDFAGVFKNGIGIGEVCIFGCVACWVFYLLLGKTVLTDLSPLVTVAYSSVAGSVLLFFAAFHNGIFDKIRHYLLKDWFSIIYLAVFGTVAGYVWFYDGLRRIGATRTALFINLIPVFTVILSLLILGEPVTNSLLIGTPLVIIGIYLTNRIKVVSCK
jgi:drug/metabolite transporter (DMT)-like permease